jgi:peptidoglycan hydrolase-like protein with peptidoglycan-binding domain
MSAKSTAPAKTGSASSKTVHSSSKRGPKGQPVAKARRPSYQSAPSPERYQQIQQSLADRGFYKGEVNGVWGAESQDAMKRFQESQNLPDDGKITSKALIGLGLGPNHGTPGTNQPGTTQPGAPVPPGSAPQPGTPVPSASPATPTPDPPQPTPPSATNRR